MSVKVVYEDVAVGAADAATVASSDANAFSSIQDLPHGTNQLLIETNEPNQWILDGSFGVLVGGAEQGRLHLRGKPDDYCHAGRCIRIFRHLL